MLTSNGEMTFRYMDVSPHRLFACWMLYPWNIQCLLLTDLQPKHLGQNVLGQNTQSELRNELNVQLPLFHNFTLVSDLIDSFILMHACLLLNLLKTEGVTIILFV